MANEWKHSEVGLGLTEAEYDSIAAHEADGQTEGDVLWFNGTSWVRISLNALCVLYADALLVSLGVQDAIDTSIDTHEAAADPHTGYQKESEKGAASGYASLNASSKVTEQPASITDHIIDEDSMASNLDTKVPTQQSVKAYVDALIAANDAMVFKGVIDCSGNPNYPAADCGHVYKVSVAGKIGGASGVTVEAGDTLICKTDSSAEGDHATVGVNWIVLQTNIDITTLVLKTDVDDTPADGATTDPISSNWAFDHAADTSTHGASDIADVSDIAVDANLSAAAQAVVTAGACDTDANLSAAAQAAIAASHTQGTDTTLGALTADIDFAATYQCHDLQAPAAAGEAIRQTAKITEASLEALVDGGGGDQVMSWLGV